MEGGRQGEGEMECEGHKWEARKEVQGEREGGREGRREGRRGKDGAI